MSAFDTKSCTKLRCAKKRFPLCNVNDEQGNVCNYTCLLIFLKKKQSFVSLYVYILPSSNAVNDNGLLQPCH